MKRPHVCRFLPGSIEPAAVLELDDIGRIKEPKMGRGMRFDDLGSVAVTPTMLRDETSRAQSIVSNSKGGSRLQGNAPSFRPSYGKMTYGGGYVAQSFQAPGKWGSNVAHQPARKRMRRHPPGHNNQGYPPRGYHPRPAYNNQGYRPAYNQGYRPRPTYGQQYAAPRPTYGQQYAAPRQCTISHVPRTVRITTTTTTSILLVLHMVSSINNNNHKGEVITRQSLRLSLFKPCFRTRCVVVVLIN